MSAGGALLDLNRGFVVDGGALPDPDRGFVSDGGALPDLNRGFVSDGGALPDLDRGFGADDGASPDEDSDLIEAFGSPSPCAASFCRRGQFPVPLRRLTQSKCITYDEDSIETIQRADLERHLFSLQTPEAIIPFV